MEKEQGFQIEVERLQNLQQTAGNKNIVATSRRQKVGELLMIFFFWKAEIGNVHSPESLIIVNNRMYSSTLLIGRIENDIVKETVNPVDACMK